jgi:DNA-binding transcriptional LysR family regulator
MTLDQIRTFQAVAAAHSFRRAASILHLTQPAVSKQIRALEAELGLPLLERRKNTRLTAAGAALLKHAERLAVVLRSAREEIADIKDLRGGNVSLGATHSFATYVLPGLIGSFRLRYPGVHLSIESGWSPDLARRVAAHELDFGLIVLVSPKMEGHAELRFVPLATWDLEFVVGGRHPLSKKSEVTWDDLEDVPWILNQEGCQFRGYVEKRLKERGRAMKVEVDIIGFELQKRLTQLGLGVSLLPKEFATREISQRSLKVLDVKGTRPQAYTCLAFRKDKYIHGAMRAFFELLEERFDPAKSALKKYL